jgi:hypothetical protein
LAYDDTAGMRTLLRRDSQSLIDPLQALAGYYGSPLQEAVT